MATIKMFGKEYKYILEYERAKTEKGKEIVPEDKRTIWYYKLPTLDAQFNKSEEVVFEESTDKDGNKKSVSRLIPANEVRKQIAIIKGSLIRVEKLFTDDKQPASWPDDDKQQEEFIATLPHTWRVELADAFRQAATISEEEVKN